MSDQKTLPYDISNLPREQRKYYIGADEKDTQEMLSALGAADLGDLFAHIDKEDLFAETPNIGKELNYNDLKRHVEEVSQKTI